MKNRKVFDCFLFYNEMELLELRLMELYDVVDYFVLIEANRTFKNNPKPYYYDLNKDFYKEFSDKIIHIKYDNPPNSSKENIWVTEYAQRNVAMEYLKIHANIGDKIILSDVDEIINPDVILENKNSNIKLSLEQNLYYYYVNCKAKFDWKGPCIANYGDFNNMQELRNFGRGNMQSIKNAGWHYSYLTGLDNVNKIVEKVNNTSDGHTAIDKIGNLEDIKRKIKNRQCLWDEKKITYDIVDISNNSPKSMNRFLQKYPKFLYKD